jgi:hypothetical protein
MRGWTIPRMSLRSSGLRLLRQSLFRYIKIDVRGSELFES